MKGKKSRKPPGTLAITQTESRRYCGRDFSPQDIRTIRRIISEDPDRPRLRISKIVCQTLEWLKPDGGLKDMSCRVALIRMQNDGLIQLPPPRNRAGCGKIKPIVFTPRTLPGPPIVEPVHLIPEPYLTRVSSKDESRLWNEYIQRYHYLGYKPLPGAQIRYFVHNENQPLALFGFSAAAWKTAPRDEFIGWTPSQRQRNLHLVVNNARFLILPWISSKNLASKILSLAARRLPDDWMKIYNYAPVLIESFVQTDKFEGTCYKAANWRKVGVTKGRGKCDRHKLYSLPKKDIWLYPLCKDFKARLLS